MTLFLACKLTPLLLGLLYQTAKKCGIHVVQYLLFSCMIHLIQERAPAEPEPEPAILSRALFAKALFVYGTLKRGFFNYGRHDFPAFELTFLHQTAEIMTLERHGKYCGKIIHDPK